MKKLIFNNYFYLDESDESISPVNELRCPMNNINFKNLEMPITDIIEEYKSLKLKFESIFISCELSGYNILFNFFIDNIEVINIPFSCTYDILTKYREYLDIPSRRFIKQFLNGYNELSDAEKLEIELGDSL